jgi:hypothetical protein
MYIQNEIQNIPEYITVYKSLYTNNMYFVLGRCPKLLMKKWIKFQYYIITG